MNFLLEIYLTLVCRKYGVKVVEMTSYEDLLRANSFLQEESANYFGHEKIPQTEELVRPEGLVGSFCIQKGQTIIGTVSLFDPMRIESFASHAYTDHELHFDKAKTLELGRLILKLEEQRADSLTYFLLLHACYKRTKACGRTQWLCTGHYRIIRQAKYLGGQIKILARGTKIAQKDNFQTYYYSNLKIEEAANNYSAFLVRCDDKALQRAIKKYCKKKWK
ncbi:MAG: hypothetical protein AAFV25_25615, partial [Bacteroidota bacterium]